MKGRTDAIVLSLAAALPAAAALWPSDTAQAARNPKGGFFFQRSAPAAVKVTIGP